MIVTAETIPKELKIDGDCKKVVHVFQTVHASQDKEILRGVLGRLTAWLEDGVIVVRSSLARASRKAMRLMGSRCMPLGG